MATIGPWYAVYLIRILFGGAILFLLFWPYVLVPELRLHSWGGIAAPLLVTPAVFLFQRDQIEQASGRSYQRCLDVIARARRGEQAEDPAELAAVAKAFRPQLVTAWVRWAIPAMLLAAAALLAFRAPHLSARLVGSGWAVLVAVALFAALTRQERRNRVLRARLDAAVAG